MARAKKEASVDITEGEAVASITAILESLENQKSIIKVVTSVSALFEGWYIET